MSDGGAPLSSISSIGSPKSPLGAPLTMSFSHAEELNAEMDMLDAEVMGENDLQDLHSDPVDDIVVETQGIIVATINIIPHGPHTPSPPAAHDLSLHLQHLQDQIELDMQEEPFFNHSTSPFPHIPLSPLLSGTLGEVAIVQQSSVQPASSQSALSDSVGWENVPPPPLIFLGSTVNNLEEDFLQTLSQTDDNEVEDNNNLTLGEFLYSWAHATTRGEFFLFFAVLVWRCCVIKDTIGNS